MALHVPRAPGFASMLKDGAQFFSGVEEAVVRNIGACREFAATVQSAYGPNGMNKVLIINKCVNLPHMYRYSLMFLQDGHQSP